MPAEEDLEDDRRDQYQRRLEAQRRGHVAGGGQEAHDSPHALPIEDPDPLEEDPDLRRHWTDGISDASTDIDVRRWK